MSKINPKAFEKLPKAKKEKITEPSDEYKKISDEANKRIRENLQKEREALINAQSFICLSSDNEDNILNLIKLIRASKTDEEAKKILMQNINVILDDEDVKYIIDYKRKELPDDEYYLKKQAEEEIKNLTIKKID